MAASSTALFGLVDLFDEILISYDVGVHKPDPAIFAAAEDRLPAEQYVYVGDEYESDIEPARDAGWFAVHIDHDADTRVVHARDVTEVTELSRLLG